MRLLFGKKINLLRSGKWMLLFLLGTQLSLSAIASDDPEQLTVFRGRLGQLTEGTTMETIDVHYYDPIWSTLIKDPSKDIYQNTISFMVDDNNGKYISDSFTAVVKFKLTWTDMSGMDHSEDSVTLSVSYNNREHSKYDGRNSYVFDKARKVKIEIQRVILVSANELNSMNSLKLESRMRVKRDYIFVPAALTPSPATLSQGELFYDFEDDYSESHTHYDIEWAWVDKEAQDRYKVGVDFNETLIFKNNSTRVTIPASDAIPDEDPESERHSSFRYKIPMLYDGEGLLFYRLRPVQYAEDGNIFLGEWTSLAYYEFTGHETELNWQASTTYAEDGKRKSVVQYFDGTLRNRQTVTKDNTVDTTIIAETLYDYQGRPAINILPAPTLSSMISFAKNFNRFESNAYQKDIYDLLETGDEVCSFVSPILDSSSGSSRYYSSNNGLGYAGFHQYIPSAYGYPYSETVYTRDGTGRIAAQGGVGPVFQINNKANVDSPSRETRYYYGSPDQKELDALFGTEVGTADHYFKNMVRDPNGQYSVSYVDMHGRTIATALAGARPANLDSIANTPKYITKSLITGSNNVVKDRSVVSTSTILVSKAGDHEFHYEVGPQSAEIQACNPPGSSVCYDCYYDLEIRITGDCGGEPRIIRRTNFNFASYDTSCSTQPGAITVDTTINLLEGEYSVVKTLSLSKNAQNWYRDSVFAVKNLCKTLVDFYNEHYSVMIDSSHCNDVYDCDSCNLRLGSPEAFRANFLAQQGIDPGTTVDYEAEISAAYNEAKKACDALCPEKQEPESRLLFLRQMMLDDMMPGRGQYALLDEKINDDEDLDDAFSLIDGKEISQNDMVNQNKVRFETNTKRPYNIFNFLEGNTSIRPYTSPRTSGGAITFYPGENGLPDPVLDPNPPVGDTYESFLQFTNVFRDEWAQQLLYHHPEYPKLKYAEDNLSASYEWDAHMNIVETWAEAQTKGYIGNLVSIDPLFTGSEAWRVAMRTKMTTYMTSSYRNTGKTLWQLAWIAGNCPDPATNACMNTPSSLPPFTFPDGCTSDQDMTWKLFRNMYLAEKENMIAEHLNSLPGFVKNSDLESRFYQPRLGATMSMNVGSISSGDIQSYVDGNDPNGLTGAATAQMEQMYKTQCEGYIGLWKSKLSECTLLTEAIIDEITQKLTQVCINGSDEDHPLGSSTVNPAKGGSPASFEQAIREVLNAHDIDFDAVCHPFMIDFPQPYDKQAAVANDVAVIQQDSCLCTRLTELKAEKAQSGYTGTLSQYLQYQHGVTISQGKLDTLIAGCNGDGCKFYDPPFEIPAIFSCGGQNTQNCIDCEQYRQLKKEFKQTYPDFASVNIIHENPDGDSVMLNENLLFEKFMNTRTGISKSWVDYLLFEKACAAYDSTWNCGQLDSIVALYYLSHPDTLYGAACKSSFTTFFNSAFGTAFSFTQIQQLFMAHCGHLPDVCQAEITCQKFQYVIDSFYTRYGASIGVTGGCQELFEDHFNTWFGSDYTYGELQNLYQTVCGGVLDVCGHIDCSKLQAAIDSWNSCHHASQLNEDCNGEWVTYFNGIMHTGLTSWQIDSLYRSCNIPLMPCQPQVTCKLLSSLLTSYNNLGYQSCAGSGVDTLSSTGCNDCFVWFVNDRLGTSYSLDEIKLMYQKVCGTDLSLCAATMDCSRLSGFTQYYLNWYQNLSPVGNCDSLFVQQFNIYFAKSYTYNQIMALYRQYCGKLPLICKKNEPVSCTELQRAYNEYLQLYPMPQAYFGPNCQAAFTKYFNQYFGDSLTWNEVRAYYLSMCGQDLDVCSVTTPGDSCLVVQKFMSKHSVQLNNVVMPKQACIDVYSRMFNSAFSSRVTYKWADVERAISGCGQTPVVCNDFTAPNTQIVSGARRVFDAYYYDGVPGKTDQVFTEFFNLYYKTSFANYSQLQQWAKDNFDVDFNIVPEGTPKELSVRLRVPQDSIPPMPVNMPPRLCGFGTLIPSITIDPVDPCAQVAQMALNAATEDYSVYVTRQLDKFDSTYQARCLAVAPEEVFTVRSQVAEYHYTLYYYDQAGSLVKTVPPAGVNLSKMEESEIDTWHATVDAARANGTASPVIHTMPTEYRYNTLGQVILQTSPDGGTSRFWYDRLGRLVVSQNAKQEKDDKYSYTRYDVLGRITEVGQLTAAEVTQAITQNEEDLQEWFMDYGLTGEQITKTVYDVPAPGICESPHILCQQNLRNRVSYTMVKPTISFTANGSAYEMATFFTYDIHGNVDTLVHHYNSGIMQSVAGNAFKRIAYKYDLVSGKVNEVAYQPGVTDQFYHRYKYDAENKLTAVYTSPDSVFWERQATYEYYRHGPLARTVLGELQVQGVDYAYTLQGWLKGVNSSALNTDTDMGQDNVLVAHDVFGFSLNYFAGDYRAINNARHPFASMTAPLPTTGDNVEVGKDLFNGNISSMIVSNLKLDGGRVYGYRYDQLNRLKAMNAYTGVDYTTNTVTPATSGEYKERMKYDGNGNILNYLRNGTSANPAMDDLDYEYIAGTNKLHKVVDHVTTSTYAEDIKNGQSNNNYKYDEIGNLIIDEASYLIDPVDHDKPMIEWNVYGKISKVTKIKDGITTIISYTYDPSGNRISKTVNVNGVVSYTWYVRDAAGNSMAIYEKRVGLNGDSLSQSQVHLYGSSRLGYWNSYRNVQKNNWSFFEIIPMTNTTGRREERWIRGLQYYELTNQLENVTVVISDRNYQHPDNLSHQFPAPVLFYDADVVSAADYYSFGMQMVGRIGNFEKDYRYGFNGKETDNEIKGDGNSLDFGSRVFDSRLGRFLSVDRMIAKTPYYSPYLFAGNKPIVAIDQDGDIEIIIHVYEKVKDPETGKIKIYKKYTTVFNVPTLEDARGIYRTPAEVNVYFLSTPGRKKQLGNTTYYEWTTTLNAVEDKENTGLTRYEEIKVTDPANYYSMMFFQGLTKPVGLWSLTQAMTGENVETGERLSKADRWVQFAGGLISLVSAGRASAAGNVGLNWIKDQIMDFTAERALPMLIEKVLGVKDKGQISVLSYYIGRMVNEAKKGDLKKVQDLIIKCADMGVKGTETFLNTMKYVFSVDANMPIDSDKALQSTIDSYLMMATDKDSKKIIDNYKKQH